MRRLFFIIAVSIVGVFGYCQAAKLSDVVSPFYYNKLLKEQKIELIHEDWDTSLVLLPISPYSEDVRSGRLDKSGKKIVPFNAEYLYLVPKNDGDDTVIEGVKCNIDDISHTFRALSRMKGMRYHFEKKKPELLYKDVFMVASPDSTDPVPDPVEGSADGIKAYCLQDDNTYGKLCYELNYKQNETTVYVEFHLASPMTFLGLTVVDSDNAKVNVIAIDCEEGVLLYMGTDVAARKMGPLNVRKQVAESMAVRIEAIYRWFLGEL